MNQNDVVKLQQILLSRLLGTKDMQAEETMEGGDVDVPIDISSEQSCIA